VLFIDDLHMDFRTTPRTRQLLKDMLKELIHDGDMFGIVTSGHSSISEQLTYDRQVLESAISRVTNGGLRPKEIIEGTQSSQGPTELRHRAHVAFSTAYDLVKNLEKVQHRRKAIIYISSGYDFNPFERSRLEEQARRWNVENVDDLANDPFIRQQSSSQALAESDLIRELAELTRAANRANASFYTIDPRGLVAGPDMDDEGISTQDWNEFVRESQDSLRVLAEETGGFAIVNQNDFSKGLKRIDNETSDYYVIGYYSKNPDPLKRTRRIEISVQRDGARVTHSRTSYTLRPNPR
jgi:VWFA-related protein